MPSLGLINNILIKKERSRLFSTFLFRVQLEQNAISTPIRISVLSCTPLTDEEKSFYNRLGTKSKIQSCLIRKKSLQESRLNLLV